MKSIQEYLKRIETIKVKAPDTLFDVEPNWEVLKDKKCPICGSLLKTIRNNKKIVMCRGRRHGNRKPFIITASAYYRIVK